MKYFRTISLLAMMLVSTLFFGQDEEAMCKEWVFKGTEEFGVIKKPKKGKEGNALSFMCNEDKTIFVTENNEAKSGTWSISRGYIYIQLKDSEEKKRYKFISVSESELVIEFQTPDLVRTKYIYTPKGS